MLSATEAILKQGSIFLVNPFSNDENCAKRNYSPGVESFRGVTKKTVFSDFCVHTGTYLLYFGR